MKKKIKKGLKIAGILGIGILGGYCLAKPEAAKQVFNTVSGWVGSKKEEEPKQEAPKREGRYQGGYYKPRYNNNKQNNN